MSNDYAIIRVEKIKTKGAMKNRLDHNHREKDVPNANPKVKNPHIQHTPKTTDEALDVFNTRLGKVKNIRKNAVLGLEYLMTSDLKHFEKLSERQIRKWAKASVKFIVKKHGKENIVSVTFHRDERTPHLHVIVVPAVEKIRQWTNPETKKKENKPGALPELKLCAKDFVGGPEILKNLWTEYARHMKKFGLKRGRINSHASHKTIGQYSGEAQENEHLKQVVKDQKKELRRLNVQRENERISLKNDIDRLKSDLERAKADKEHYIQNEKGKIEALKKRALQEQADTHAREIKERENKIDNLKYHLALAKEDKKEYIQKEQKNIEALKNSEMQKTADECERKRQELAQELEQSKKDNDKYIEDEKEKLEQYKNTQLTNLENLRKLQEQELKKRERELEQREREAEEYKTYKDRYTAMQKLVNQLHGKGGGRMLTPEDIINEAVDAYNKRVQQQRTQEKYRGRS